MSSPNHLSYKTEHLAYQSERPPLAPEQAAAIGGMSIAATTIAEMSGGMMTPRQVERMAPEQQSNMHAALQMQRMGEELRAKDAAYRNRETP